LSAWTKDELDRIGGADNDDLYISSAVKGRAAAWYRATGVTGRGHVSAGKVEKDVAFEASDHGLDDAIDAAYRAKYRQYGARIVNSCLSADARSTTIRLIPEPHST
jgi:hypothetical protein